MTKLLLDYLPVVIPVFSSIMTAIVGVVIAWLSASKAKAEAAESVSRLEIANSTLETEKIKLETSIIEGSYIICPNCGYHIPLKDMKVYVDKKEVI